VIEYESGEDEPTVRRVNPAFRETFGVAAEPAGRDLETVLASAADTPDADECDSDTSGEDERDTGREPTTGGQAAGEPADAGTAADGSAAAKVVDRVRAGEALAVRVTCGTETGSRSFLLRTLPAGEGGYVVYSDLPAASVSPDRVDMVDALAHDIRNPLEVAEIYLEAARESGEDAHFAEVEAAHERLEHIAEDALRLTKEGRVIDEPSPTDVDAVVTEAWRSVRADGAALRAGDVGTAVADADRLQQLFENLFRNAVTHCGEDVTVEVGPLGADDGAVTGFYVADDGPGIPPAERDQVLEPGYTTAVDGTGLGLPIVLEIADAHGWRVDVTESSSGGARFEFTGVAPADG
jgi:signal transduction histidine kinase